MKNHISKLADLNLTLTEQIQQQNRASRQIFEFIGKIFSHFNMEIDYSQGSLIELKHKLFTKLEIADQLEQIKYQINSELSNFKKILQIQKLQIEPFNILHFLPDKTLNLQINHTTISDFINYRRAAPATLFKMNNFNMIVIQAFIQQTGDFSIIDKNLVDLTTLQQSKIEVLKRIKRNNKSEQFLAQNSSRAVCILRWFSGYVSALVFNHFDQCLSELQICDFKEVVDVI
ncbi:hypothetical protein SS50377_22456 [Spironucleus salmonicida]|uniref:Uncharacterized protein n=1 Tax=Spironucleus salmonicida TaxID=348837 RepID=V6LCS3_9EUKA|nr:hypothetical protein SS50377_22456 [Spironucleus salmonicida]|eukprot:EST42053.1 Hypothetical protein SS50377_18360 [Spironucleus salmonicida]